ncbi:MAG TPA: winged helix-turn-helix domain-containing protein, partial [Candidatus Thermoplasmatota archaeon]|nr:winged helix-turn-helix domain-containing protein [Candidatus Thermoplasmatota archaeon]
MDRITLDRAVFKALASDTRLDILKALDERQKTVTELAKQLDLNKATVFEHLEKLAEVGLIQKLEDERKWVYWQLSWTGRRLLHPEKITLALLLSTSLGAILTASAALWLWVRSNVAQMATGGDAPPEGPGIRSAAPESADAESMRAYDATAGSTPTEEIAVAPEVQHDPVFLAIAVALGVAA